MDQDTEQQEQEVVINIHPYVYIEYYLLYLGSITSGRFKTKIFKEGFKGKIFIRIYNFLLFPSFLPWSLRFSAKAENERLKGQIKKLENDLRLRNESDLVVIDDVNVNQELMSLKEKILELGRSQKMTLKYKKSNETIDKVVSNSVAPISTTN